MEYQTYRRYKDSNEANLLIKQLELNGISYQIEDVSPIYDITFTGGTDLEDKVAVKIKSEEFNFVDKILEEAAVEDIQIIDNDHYLNEFTDKELLEVLENYDEWSKTDFIYAQKLLKNRGIEISTEEIEKLKEKKIIKLSMPEKGKAGWMILGYISAFFGGIIGIFIGHHLYKFKKQLPNGDKVYAYDINTRKNGFWIYYIGMICFACWVCISIFNFILNWSILMIIS
jgi:hypothetical protein